MSPSMQVSSKHGSLAFACIVVVAPAATAAGARQDILTSRS
eukprot:CAMPEP_0202371342 /NCGR_PEP_ID=MMETSP1127-20130417/2776_1 /ASSEMBLY_ACC=CAM_ASM_000462 /TAXON_ID=3047 /ORGANISM="Dunaliella tertiolecta, Strain CCMP1320" /LENGTH=40 /DNA_ID= /DNA_START= /DNA_END= /DNA_ORIENTATION=